MSKPQPCNTAIMVFALLLPCEGKPTNTRVDFYQKIGDKLSRVQTARMMQKPVADIIAGAATYYYKIVEI